MVRPPAHVARSHLAAARIRAHIVTAHVQIAHVVDDLLPLVLMDAELLERILAAHDVADFALDELTAVFGHHPADLARDQVGGQPRSGVGRTALGAEHQLVQAKLLAMDAGDLGHQVHENPGALFQGGDHAAHLMDHGHAHGFARGLDCFVDLLGIDHLAAQSHDEHAPDVGVFGQVDQRAGDLCGIRRWMQAALVVADGHGTANQALKMRTQVVDTADGRDDGDVVTRPHPAIRPGIAIEFHATPPNLLIVSYITYN